MALPVTASRPRIVVADDSAFMRRMLVDALVGHGFEVVGEARNGDEAVEQAQRLQPDAMTLDLSMPGLDGVGVLRALTDKGGRTLPIVVVSAFSPKHLAKATDALAEGAFDFLRKPPSPEARPQFFAELGEKVALAASTMPVRWITHDAKPAAPRPASTRRRSGVKKTVVIATSTGGPRALAQLLPQLPSPLGAGGLIVQHMPRGFTKSLAIRLDAASALNVREAGAGEELSPDALLLAPGGNHLRLDPTRRTFFSHEKVVSGLCPLADFTILDAVERFGARVVLVVLTGMGRDGLEGARAVKSRGGVVLAQDADSCTVYGMSRSVVEAGLADEVLPLDDLPAAIAREAGA